MEGRAARSLGTLVVLGILIVLRIDQKPKIVAGAVIASVGSLGLLYALP